MKLTTLSGFSHDLSIMDVETNKPNSLFIWHPVKLSYYYKVI